MQDIQDTNRPTGRVEKIQGLYERTKRAWASFRSRQFRNYEYLIGNQIDPEIREELRQQRRPALVFNLLQNKIVTVAGLIEQGKVFMRAVPLNEGDEKGAEMHTMLVSDWAMRNCNGSSEMAKAGLDAAIGGIGWINNYWSTKNNIQGEWITESYDPFMVLFDHEARRQDQRDWRYLAVTGFYSAEEIIAMFADSLTPEMVEEIKMRDDILTGIRRGDTDEKPVSWADRLWSGISDTFERAFSSKKTTDYEDGTINDYVDIRVGKYRVIEWHDRRMVRKITAYNPETRQRTEIKTPQERALVELAARQSGKPVYFQERMVEELWITVVCPWLLPHTEILEKPYSVQGRGFQLKPVFCYDFHPDITKMVSLIDVLIDPQDSYNQRRMSFLEWLMDAVNPEIHAPKNSIDPADLTAWQSSDRGTVKFFNVIGGMKPEAQHPLAEASSLKVFSDEDRDLAETLSQITPNTQGMSENSNESGVLFAQRVQQSMVALSYFFGHLHDAMRETFNYCDRALQVHMTMPRKIRLLNKTNDPTWVQLNMQTVAGVANDVGQGEYDFAVDTNTVGETMKQIKFAEALNFIKVVPPELVKWDSVFKLWDSPVAAEMAQWAQAMMGVQVAQQAQVNAQAAMQGQMDAATGAAGVIGAAEEAATAGVPPQPSPVGGGAQV